ncbi:uncharacterized [Tachysurus ichikawai]
MVLQPGNPSPPQPTNLHPPLHSSLLHFPINYTPLPNSAMNGTYQSRAKTSRLGGIAEGPIVEEKNVCQSEECGKFLAGQAAFC